jgi:ssDNA-binding replication factor A large subunit
MVLQKYEQLVDKIANASGLTVNDVMEKVEAKCAKLSGLISKEGSAQIVASELGVNLDEEKMKVGELMDGMRKVKIVGKIVQEPRISEFTTKNGAQSKVLSTMLADDSGNVRTVLWDVNHIALFDEGKLKNNQIVEISNASIRNNELHLGSFSEIKPSSEEVGNVKTVSQGMEKIIGEVKPGENVKMRAVVVQIFQPKFFEVNKDTGRKVTEEEKKAGAEIEKRALLGIVLDDGSENMRGVMFGDQIKQLGFEQEDLENFDQFMKKKNEILGKEAFFSCNVRTNNLFNTTELIVNGVEEIDIDSLIESLKA